MKQAKIIYIILCLCILWSCKTQKQVEVNENFDSFYEKFIGDQEFQVSRITFPLECAIFEGMLKEDDHSKSVIQTKEEWHPFLASVDEVDQSVYKVEKSITPEIVTHRVYIEDSGVDILMKYKLIGRKWHLVYYMSVMM